MRNLRGICSNDTCIVKIGEQDYCYLSADKMSRLSVLDSLMPFIDAENSEKGFEINFKDYISIDKISVEKFNENPNSVYFISKFKELIQRLPAEYKIT